MKTETTKLKEKKIKEKECSKSISKKENYDLSYIDWILDKGWLRTKK